MKNTMARCGTRKKRIHGKVATIRLAMKDCVGGTVDPARQLKYLHQAARNRHALHQSREG